ncbi:MAG: LamG-like jellyroll fold domain-containing protein [Bacteroidota bacterium]|jgi:hypothetical protein
MKRELIVVSLTIFLFTAMLYPQSPVARTGAAQDILDTSAVLAGTVKSMGQTTAWQFEYGANSSYGTTTAGDSVNDPGNALCLDSAGARATVPDEEQLRLINGFTLEAWFRHDSLTPPLQVARILSKVVDGHGTGYSLGIDEYGKIWYTSFGVHDYVTTNSYIDTGVWYHVAVVLATNQDARFYVNGNYEETVFGGWGSAIQNTDTLYMGYYVAGWYFKGLIDEIRIWNTVLADSTIKRWMGKTVTASHPDYSHLVGYWCFNETSGTTAHDQSSYGDSATLNNATFVPGARDIPVYQYVSGLSATSVYHFRVDASNGGGSAHGDDSMFTTLSTLPIQLASLTAATVTSGVKLEWTTVSETNNYGFYVERHRQDSTVFRTVSTLIPGAGTSLSQHHYSWVDSTVTDGNYIYRVRQVDLNGSLSYSQPITVNVVLGVSGEVAPKKFQLLQNYPNPFNPSATIKFSVEHAEHAALIVYDMLGQEVARLFDGAAEPGHYYRLTFDGSRVGSGLYIYRIVTDSHTDVKKMLLLK